jgi:hypothetical protein
LPKFRDIKRKAIIAERNHRTCASDSWLLLDNLPLFVEEVIYASCKQRSDAHSRHQNVAQEGWSHNIDKKAVTEFIGFVEGLVHQCVVENKQFVIAPVIRLAADDDVS